MPVEISKPGAPDLFPLTSPPKEPQPLPSKEILHKIVDCVDRKVWVTVPFPDYITLVAEVLSEHTIAPDLSAATGKHGKSTKQIYKNLDKEISDALENAHLVAGGNTSLVKKSGGATRSFRFSIRYDDDQPLNRASLTASRRPGPDFGTWTIKLEFNPYKAGPQGLAEIIEGFEEALGPLDFYKMLADFKIGRVDAAIDCIGAHPLDLIAHIPKKGKRAIYFGDDGRPQTVYFYHPKAAFTKPPKQLGVRTMGPLRLTLYERRNYHLQLALPPPYGPSPVTRAEVTLTWKKNRPKLAALGSIPNAFEGRRVA